jgi:hypothetical protein
MKKIEIILDDEKYEQLVKIFKKDKNLFPNINTIDEFLVHVVNMFIDSGSTFEKMNSKELSKKFSSILGSLDGIDSILEKYRDSSSKEEDDNEDESDKSKKIKN